MKSLKSWGKKNRQIDSLEWLLCQKWPKTQNEKWDEHKISSKVRATEDFIEQFCAPPCAQFYWIFQSQLQNIARAPYLLPKIFSNEICSKFLPVKQRAAGTNSTKKQRCGRYELGDMVGRNLNIFQQDFTTLPELSITRTTHHLFGCFGPKLSNF